MNKFPTNIEQVTSYMEMGAALAQPFVMEAIDRYAKQVFKDKEAVIKSLENSFISGEAWVDAAEKWLKQRGITDG